MWLAAVLSLVLVVLIVMWFESANQKTPEYHLGKLNQAGEAYNAAIAGEQIFRIAQLRYTLGIGNPGKDLRKHENALLEMGYFRQTNFTFMSTNHLKRFFMNTRNAAFRDTNWSLSVEGTNVSLTAAALDLELWGTIASKVNEAE